MLTKILSRFELLAQTPHIVKQKSFIVLTSRRLQ